MQFILAAIMVFASLSAVAEERFKNESELGVSVVSGNANTESYSLKQLSSYDLDGLNKLHAQGRYNQGRTSGVETARAWGAALKYERALSDLWSAFLSQTAESDVYANYVQRNSTDLGAKYYFTKNDKLEHFAEAGYRYQYTQYVVQAADVEPADNAVRLYTEASYKLSPSASAKLWVEYIPSMKDREVYLLNAEPSVSAILSETFSLKTSYLVKYQNPSKSTRTLASYTDTTFLTSIVAKF
ncbi:MAG TPA: DUF481 domain-containing protein [Bdellovibrionales bacterium]|nr:DUF481 domain-containing protein [Bdellovibrionales bacterium]